MNKVEILVIGKNEKLLQAIIRLINGNEQWNGIGAGSDEEAIEKFHQRDFDMVLLTDGISAEEERKLKKIFFLQRPDIIVLQHNDAKTDLLSIEIMDALNKRREENKPTVSLTDDALKNARLHITFQ